MEAEGPRLERRSGEGRRAEDRTERWRSFAAGVLALCGALSVVYFIFAALGAVDLGDAAVGSAIALGLGVLWLSRCLAAGALRRRLRDPRRPRAARVLARRPPRLAASRSPRRTRAGSPANSGGAIRR